MKKFNIAIVVLVVAVVGFILTGKQSNDISATRSTKQSSTGVTSFDQVSASIAKGGQLLDVRTAEEYAAGHIDGATNFPLQTMQAGSLPSGSKSQAIFVYCHSGNRAGQATTILKKAGYTNVTNLGAITHVESIGGKLVARS